MNYKRLKKYYYFREKIYYPLCLKHDNVIWKLRSYKKKMRMYYPSVIVLIISTILIIFCLIGISHYQNIIKEENEKSRLAKIEIRDDSIRIMERINIGRHLHYHQSFTIEEKAKIINAINEYYDLSR